MSDAGDTGTDTGQNTDGGEAEAQGNPQLDALAQRMDQMAEKFDGFDELRDAILNPADDTQGDDLYGDLYGDLETTNGEIDDPLYEGVSPEEVKQAQQKLDQMIDQRAQKLIGPLEQQLTEMRVRGEANDIARELPDLDDPEKAKAAMQRATTDAQRLGVPDLAGEPWFIRMSHLAGRAEAAMQQETPAGGQDQVHLEGSGISPQSSQDLEDEFGDRIVNAGGNPYGGFAR